MLGGEFLTVQTSHNGPVCVLTIAGELDLLTSPVLLRQAAEALRETTGLLVLNLSGLTFADCAGARTLQAIVCAAPPGCAVTARAVSPQVRRVLDLMTVNAHRTPALGDHLPVRRARKLAGEAQAARAMSSELQARSRQVIEACKAAQENAVTLTLTAQQWQLRRPCVSR